MREMEQVLLCEKHPETGDCGKEKPEMRKTKKEENNENCS